MSIRHMDGVCVCMSMSMWYFMLFYYAILTLTPNGVAVMELWQSSQDWWTPFTHFFIICDFVFIHCLVFFSAPTALCILYTFALCFKVYWLYLVGILKYAVSFILVKLVAFPLFFAQTAHCIQIGIGSLSHTIVVSFSTLFLQLRWKVVLS